MKGLLIKDWKLLKAQRTFLIVAAVISIGFLSSGNNTQFAFTYLTAMLAVLTTSTISYDETSNGMGYLFTLPVDRRHYVMEKYIFGIIMFVLALSIMSAVTALMCAMHLISMGQAELASLVLSSILASAIMQSIIIPVQLKFGSEKSRIAFLIIMAGTFIIGYGFMQIKKLLPIDASALIRQLKQASTAAVFTGIIILSAILMFISFVISSAIMKRKQF